MSRNPKGNPIDGMLLLDKPFGMSSNRAVQSVKRLMNARKVGHTGSLDPIATGLLPLCLGEATKLSSFLLNTDKRYEVLLRLGRTTDSGDIEGATLIERLVPELNRSMLESILDRFKGSIEQVPPMYSALKHQGRRLYDLARRGIEVERKPRSIQIYALNLLAYDATSLRLDVHCSKGTYVRSLGLDIGEALGSGAHVEELRRVQVGDFSIKDAYSLERLEALTDEPRLNALLPLSRIIEKLPSLNLPKQIAFYLLQGQAVFLPNTPTEGLVGLYDEIGNYLGIGEVMDDGKITPRRLKARA